MTPKRVVELEGMLSGSTAKIVFVSAFPDLDEIRKHIESLAWGSPMRLTT